VQRHGDGAAARSWREEELAEERERVVRAAPEEASGFWIGPSLAPGLLPVENSPPSPFFSWSQSTQGNLSIHAWMPT
jgi:hypothetical protein